MENQNHQQFTAKSLFKQWERYHFGVCFRNNFIKNKQQLKQDNYDYQSIRKDIANITKEFNELKNVNYVTMNHIKRRKTDDPIKSKDLSFVKCQKHKKNINNIRSTYSVYDQTDK
jgi:hypothetical protein